MKLKESIPSNSVKIIELYNKINSLILQTRPDFQRKLVWKKQHKFHFIGTILLNFPFPEVYIASSEMDVENLTAKEIVVDGQQRLTTIVDYIKGINDFKDQDRVTPFDKLSNEEKKDFLNYLVTVKDLKNMEIDLIKAIFQRINNTEYSLNAIEKSNAQYGDGEFVIFCKQIVDADYDPTIDITDNIIEKSTKKKLNAFFSDNNVFNENDRSRMFDLQYSMLVISTILEGSYYGRSSKVEDYLKKYNGSFETSLIALNSLIKSVDIISNLHLNSKSYWFNKANLFTLLIELSKIKDENIDFEKLESSLLEFENKNDAYFSEEDLKNISDDEKKYFEFARQGSNEKISRLHRGKVISQIINSTLKEMKPSITTSLVEERLSILDHHNIKYTTIEPTKTGLEKYLMDATTSIREFLRLNEIHNYESQENGSEHKMHKEATFILQDKVVACEISFYKANNRGDARIWISDLKNHAKENDIVAIIVKDNKTFILNVTQLGIESLVGKSNPFNEIILK